MPPRKGQLFALSVAGPPLSALQTISVLLYIPRALRAAVMFPMPSSIYVAIPKYACFPRAPVVAGGSFGSRYAAGTSSGACVHWKAM